MKLLSITLLISSFMFSLSLFGQTIWNGPSITFTKTAFSDPNNANNQDRITDLVWITRGNTQGLYNAKTESSHNSDSPAGTEWAEGTAADIGSLVFSSWKDAVNGNPPASLNKPFVLHLIEEDIYIDIEFTAWGQMQAGGGSFSYMRSTESTSSVDDSFNGDRIEIYPNPVSELLQLKNSKHGTPYQVYTMDGASLMLQGRIDQSGRIDVRALPAGTYVLRTGQEMPVRFLKLP